MFCLLGCPESPHLLLRPSPGAIGTINIGTKEQDVAIIVVRHRSRTELGQDAVHVDVVVAVALLDGKGETRTDLGSKVEFVVS